MSLWWSVIGYILSAEQNYDVIIYLYITMVRDALYIKRWVIFKNAFEIK